MKNLTLRDSNSRSPNLEDAMFLPTEATETFSFMMGFIFYAIVYIVYFLRNNGPYPSSSGLCIKTKLSAQPLIWK